MIRFCGGKIALLEETRFLPTLCSYWSTVWLLCKQIVCNLLIGWKMRWSKFLFISWRPCNKWTPPKIYVTVGLSLWHKSHEDTFLHVQVWKMSSYQKLLRIKKNDKPIKRFGSLLYRLAVPPPPPPYSLPLISGQPNWSVPAWCKLSNWASLILYWWFDLIFRLHRIGQQLPVEKSLCL